MYARLTMCLLLLACGGKGKSDGEATPAPASDEESSQRAGVQKSGTRRQQAVCAEYIALFDGLETGLPAGYLPEDEAKALAHMFPRWSGPWKKLPRGAPFQDPQHSVEVVSADDIRFAGKRYQESGIATSLATALREILETRGDKTIWMRTQGGEGISLARDIGKAVPQGDFRLLIQKQPGANLDWHLQVYPRTPPAAVALMRKRPVHPGPLFEAVADAGAGCDLASETLRLLAEGGGIDAIGKPTAHALTSCNCQMADVDAYVSILMYLLSPYPNAGWVPLLETGR